jgi:hypothetical protein
MNSLVVKAELSIPGWRIGLLSKGACLTLAEVVLTAQTVYAMSVAALPSPHWNASTVPGEAYSGLALQSAAGQRGACQVTLELVCRSKADGGFGLKYLATLNTSLLLKHVHKLFADDNNLASTMVASPLPTLRDGA